MTTLPLQLRNTEPDTRYGYCRCGCGSQTKVPSRSDNSKGRIKGVPFIWKPGHHTRICKRYVVDALTGCWNWLVGLNPNGYASVHIPRVGQRTVHKFLYELLVGSVPRGFELDHKCRNRRCINPDHLEVKTHTGNMRASPLVTKLDAERVSKIKALLASGHTHRGIAAMFGMEKTAITSINQGRTWKDIK